MEEFNKMLIYNLVIRDPGGENQPVGVVGRKSWSWGTETGSLVLDGSTKDVPIYALSQCFSRVSLQQSNRGCMIWETFYWSLELTFGQKITIFFPVDRQYSEISDFLDWGLELIEIVVQRASCAERVTPKSCGSPNGKYCFVTHLHYNCQQRITLPSHTEYSLWLKNKVDDTWQEGNSLR